MRKKIVEVFAHVIGLEGCWTRKKIFTEDEKKSRRKIASKKFADSPKGKAWKLEYRMSEQYKRLRRENYARSKPNDL